MILSIINVLFPDGLATGMEDIGVNEEGDNQDDENGAMGEEDDADLCYEKHTGKIQRPYCKALISDAPH